MLWSGKSQPMRFLGRAGNWDLLHLKGKKQRAGVWHPGKSGDEKRSSLDASVQPRERDAVYYGACYLGLVCSFPTFCLTLRASPALHVLPTFCTKPAQPKRCVTPWVPVEEFQNPTAALTAITPSSRNRKDLSSAAFPRAAQSFCRDAAVRADYQIP